MPAFDANIRLLVEAKDALRQIKKLEGRLASLEETATGKRTAAQVRNLIKTEEAGVQIAQRRLEKEIALASATELYARRKQQLNRAGGATNKQLQAQISAIEKLVELNGSNVGVVQRAATLIGRVLERQRELNRSQKEYNARASRITTEYASRISQLKNIGIAESKLNTIIEARNELIQLNDRRQNDLAKAQEDRLKRLLSSQERLNKQEKAQNKEQLAVKESLRKLDERSIQDHNTRKNLQADYLKLLQTTVAAAKFRAAQPKSQQLLALPSSEMLNKRDPFIKKIKTGEELINKSIREGNVLRERAAATDARRAQKLREQAQALTGVKNALPGFRAPLKSERLSLEASNKRASVLQRIKRTQNELSGSAEKLAAITARGVTDETRKNGQIRQQLGLRGALQALENESKVAIAKAVRDQEKDNKLTKEKLNLEKLIGKEKVKQSIQRRKAFIQEAKESRRRRKDAIGSGIIGGAFPLLFGQGPGAALGGGVGGAAGGLLGGQFGFGLSLVGTQVGVIVDQFINSISRLGPSLQEPTKALEVLSEAGIKVSKSTAFQIQQLENAGRAYDAQALLLDTLADKLGNEGVAQLQAYQDAQKTTEQALSDVKTTLLVELLPALTLAAQGVSLLASALSNITALKIPGTEENLLQRSVQDIISNTFAPGVGPFVSRTAGFIGGFLPKPQRQAPELTPEQKLQELNRTGKVSATKISTEITQLETKNLKEDNDLLNSAVVAREKSIIKLQEELKLEQLSLDIASKSLDQDGIKAAQDQISADTAKANADLQRRINKAIEAQNKSLTTRNAKLDSANTAAINAERRAKNFTAELEIQLRVLRVAGSTQAKRQRVELTYQKTLARISNLKNQDYAVQQKALAAQIRQVGLANVEAEKQQNIAAAIREATAPIRTIRDEQEANLTATKEYERLLMEGVLPSEAKRISEFNKQIKLQIDQQAELIKIVELNILQAKTLKTSTVALEEQLELYKKQQKAIKGEAAKGPGDQQKSNSEIIESRVAELKGEISELTNLGNLSVRIAENIGTAFSNAFQSVVNGSKSVREALSDVFKSIGESFVQMAAEIIQRQIQMIILQTILKALGAASGVSKGFDAPLETPITGSFGTMTPPSFPGLASGGPTDRNRTYLVGEQGPELFTPNQAGRVSSASETRSLLGRSNQGNAPAMNFTFETTNIGGKEFVDREQLEAAMAITRSQAANDGARKGMGMTLDKMQHSPATRRRVGIN